MTEFHTFIGQKDMKTMNRKDHWNDKFDGQQCCDLDAIRFQDESHLEIAMQCNEMQWNAI
jgi:hypothetical protein